MTDLHRVTCLIATDPDFRDAFRENPEEALTQRGLQISAEELASLSSVAHLLERPSAALLGQLLSLEEGPDPWMGPAPYSLPDGSRAAS